MVQDVLEAVRSRAGIRQILVLAISPSARYSAIIHQVLMAIQLRNDFRAAEMWYILCSHKFGG